MIEDPNGYNFELLERGPTPEPLCQVMLRVGDLDRSMNFYKKVSNGTQFLNIFLYCLNEFISFLAVMIVTDLKFMLFLLNLKAFGMELLHKRDNPEYKVTSHITANKFQEYFCMPVK